MEHLKIGVLVDMNEPEKGLRNIKTYLRHGFESFSLTWWQSTKGQDLADVARRVRELTDFHGAVVSSVGIFGNPLTGTGDNADTVASWGRLIEHAGDFGCRVVAGFTGRIPDRSIPESLPAYRRVFGDLGKKAADRNVLLAFENCPMGGDWLRGDWNIAHNPRAWELMFDALPLENIGLEWEPCHQLCQLIQPIPQLREWAGKVFHVHGKDATVAWDLVHHHGIAGPEPFAWHRTPGFGDSNWSDIVTILMQAGYTGSIDIEGFHDPVHKDTLELSGQVRALAYLKDCRGGEFVGELE